VDLNNKGKMQGEQGQVFCLKHWGLPTAAALDYITAVLGCPVTSSSPNLT